MEALLTLGVGAIAASRCTRGGRPAGGDDYVLNYAALLSDRGAPRHLLSAVLHF